MVDNGSQSNSIVTVQTHISLAITLTYIDAVLCLALLKFSPISLPEPPSYHRYRECICATCYLSIRGALISHQLARVMHRRNISQGPCIDHGGTPIYSGIVIFCCSPKLTAAVLTCLARTHNTMSFSDAFPPYMDFTRGDMASLQTSMLSQIYPTSTLSFHPV